MKYKCELCHDTGWYGDNGPGIKGNREYIRCECKAILKYTVRFSGQKTPVNSAISYEILILSDK